MFFPACFIVSVSVFFVNSKSNPADVHPDVIGFSNGKRAMADREKAADKSFCLRAGAGFLMNTQADSGGPLTIPPHRLSENPDLHPFEVILDTKKSGSSDLFFNPLPDLEN